MDPTLLSLPATVLKAQFDPEYGGFGNPTREWRGTKFPTPPTLSFLQREAVRTGSKDLSKMVHTTLDHMARGGIYDHLGGGFHRYSTERTWTVPHFEKMLYDNAQLLEVYATAYRETKSPLYRRTLQQTIAFVRRELTSPEGAFYCALDADSEGEEGRCYVWTSRELDAILTDEADRKLFKDVYGAEKPNFEEKYHILVLRRPLAEVAVDLKTTEDDLEKRRLAGLRARLFAVREQAAAAVSSDTKVLTGWNGQMIAGLAAAGDALGDKEAVDAARKAADFVLKNLRDKDGRLRRTRGARPGGKWRRLRLNGYLDDYAYLKSSWFALSARRHRGGALAGGSEDLDRDDAQIPRRQGAGRFLFDVRRPRKAVRAGQGSVWTGRATVGATARRPAISFACGSRPRTNSTPGRPSGRSRRWRGRCRRIRPG